MTYSGSFQHKLFVILSCAIDQHYLKSNLASHRQRCVTHLSLESTEKAREGTFTVDLPKLFKWKILLPILKKELKNKQNSKSKNTQKEDKVKVF